MILVTVGQQMPFDRLIHAVDGWAGRVGRSDLFAQVGRGGVHPRNFESAELLVQGEFRERMRSAGAIVAHAGTGTILMALELGKPLLVLPRLSALGEQRNDHQVVTARYFADRGYVLGAYDEFELFERLDNLEQYRPAARISTTAPPELVGRIRDFIMTSTHRWGS